MNVKLAKSMYFLLLGMAVIFSFLVTLGGLYIHLIGWHNTDGGQNLRWINAKYNMTLVESTSAGRRLTGDQALHLGYAQQRQGLLIIIHGVFCFAFTLCALIALGGKNEKETIRRNRKKQKANGLQRNKGKRNKKYFVTRSKTVKVKKR